MSKKKQNITNIKHSIIKNKTTELDCNGNPIDLNREYIGDKIKVPMASPSSSIYKSSATIILKGSVNIFDSKKSKSS